MNKDEIYQDKMLTHKEQVYLIVKCIPHFDYLHNEISHDKWVTHHCKMFTSEFPFDIQMKYT